MTRSPATCAPKWTTEPCSTEVLYLTSAEVFLRASQSFSVLLCSLFGLLSLSMPPWEKGPQNFCPFFYPPYYPERGRGQGIRPALISHCSELCLQILEEQEILISPDSPSACLSGHRTQFQNFNGGGDSTAVVGGQASWVARRELGPLPHLPLPAPAKPPVPEEVCPVMLPSTI